MISKVPVGTRSQKMPTPNVGLDSVDGITDEAVTQYGIDQHVLVCGHWKVRNESCFT